jgi:diketogulonate reductase-like aldo/keto reductase
LCNVTLEQLERARAVAEIATVQNRFSVQHRADRPTLEYCGENGITYLAYGTLGGPSSNASATFVDAVAKRLGVSPQRIRIAWVLAQGSHVVPLVGSSQPATIVDSLRAIDLRGADLASLELPQWP